MVLTQADTITNGTVAFVDGAKRDRTVWPGDYTVSLPSTFVSTGDLAGIRNGLDSLFLLQNASGAMPYAGGMLMLLIKTREA